MTWNINGETYRVTLAPLAGGELALGPAATFRPNSCGRRFNLRRSPGRVRVFVACHERQIVLDLDASDDALR